MRFENLEWGKRIRFLQRLHKKLNKELFNGCLNDILIDIQNLNKFDEWDDCYAQYRTGNKEFLEFFPPRILFSLEFLDRLELFKTQKEQVMFLSQIMLHEMIHQYCHENGIVDDNHSEAWQEEAAKHGLHSVYCNGELCEEWLEPKPIFVILNFQIR